VYAADLTSWKDVVAFKTLESQNEVRERVVGGIFEKYRSVATALIELDEAAAHLMAEIIAVPAP
jgi:hypothetical protein